MFLGHSKQEKLNDRFCYQIIHCFEILASNLGVDNNFKVLVFPVVEY